MRTVFYNLKDKINTYRNYRTLSNIMDKQYPTATQEELEALDDDCAICRDRMQVAKKLPCGHIFHQECLRSWLVRSDSCPTCRTKLLTTNAPSPANATNTTTQGQTAPPTQTNAPQQGQQQQQILRFATNNWLSWLPAISVELVRRNGTMPQVPVQQVPPVMIQRIREIFPHLPANVIAADLAVTGSIEATTANIIEGRLVYDESQNIPERATTTTTTESQTTPIVQPQLQRTALTQSSPSVSQVTDDPEQLERALAQSMQLAPEPVVTTQFATTTEERQKNLEAKKQALMLQAKKKFIEKKKREAERKKLLKQQEEQAKASIAKSEVIEETQNGANNANVTNDAIQNTLTPNILNESESAQLSPSLTSSLPQITSRSLASSSSSSSSSSTSIPSTSLPTASLSSSLPPPSSTSSPKQLDAAEKRRLILAGLDKRLANSKKAV